jgi:predicted Zn finger-like uncharacterized protein
MLIVCPSCATSYMIDPASVGPAGRAVRCARCKTTWFAGGPKDAPSVSSFVDGVIAEAEAETAATHQTPAPPKSADKPAEPPPAPTAGSAPPEADDSGTAPPETFPPAPDSEPAPPAFEEASHNTDLVPRADVVPEPVAPEPVAISDAPSLVPPIEHVVHAAAAAADAETDQEDIESFAARRQRLKARRQKANRSSRWTAIILVLLAFNVALIGARNEVVRYLPQTASLFAAIGLPVNLRNLKFEDVRISKETQDGVNILMIDGMIASTANKPVEVPRLRFAARNATGQDVYSWSALPSRSILGPGEKMEFHSRLASPPADAVDIMVRFFSPQDAVAGAK